MRGFQRVSRHVFMLSIGHQVVSWAVAIGSVNQAGVYARFSPRHLLLTVLRMRRTMAALPSLHAGRMGSPATHSTFAFPLAVQLPPTQRPTRRDHILRGENTYLVSQQGMWGGQGDGGGIWGVLISESFLSLICFTTWA